MTISNSEETFPHRSSVKCELHELHYNPQLSDGCVLCKREQRERESVSRLRTLALAAALLFVFGVAVRMAWTNWTGSTDSERTETAEVAEPMPLNLSLDPEPYRKTIGGIEEILYKSAPADDADLLAASLAGRDLGEEIRQRETPIISSQTTIGLLAWISSFEADMGYALPDLGRAREGWERLRAEVFRPAPWFQFSTPGLEKAQSSPPPKLDLRLASALKRVGNDINHLIRTGKPQSDEIGEVTSDASTPSTVAAIGRWDRWSREWIRRVERTAEKMPGQPNLSDDLNMVMAYQKMASALNHLRLVTMTANDYGIPFASERESRFSTAELELAAAETFLRKAGQ